MDALGARRIERKSEVRGMTHIAPVN